MTEADTIEARYRRSTPLSAKRWVDLAQVMPSGQTRNAAYFAPYPIVAAEAVGARLSDVDGNSYLDCLNNFTSFVHGNAHPELCAAARAAVAETTAYPLPHALQGDHAALLVDRIESAELVRYTNSGTEASMLATRIARAYTGRNKIVKPYHGYHGSYDGLWPLTAGRDATVGVGIPAAVAGDVIGFEFGEAEDLRRACEDAGNDLAMIILEPMLGAGGCLPAVAGVLRTARELADRHGAVLVFDEVQTLRLAPGGFQSVYDVRPDLTLLGKLIGGGFPIGAVVGCAEVMSVCEVDHPHGVAHSGTFNGHLPAMAAGARALELLTENEIDRINGYGERLRDVLVKGLVESGLAGRVTGWGSMLHCHLESRDGADLAPLFHLAALNCGVLIAPRGMLNTSTAMTDDDVWAIGASLVAALEQVSTAVGSR